MKRSIVLCIVLLFFTAAIVPAKGAKEQTGTLTPEEARTVRKEAVYREIEAREEGQTVRNQPEFDEIDIGTAVELALASNLGIHSEKIGLRLKKRAKSTWFNRFYPTITASGTLSRFHAAPDNITGLEYSNSLEYDGYNLYGITGTPNPYESPADPTDDYIVSGLPDDAPVYDYVIPYEVEIPHTWNLSAGLNMNLTLTAALIYGIKATILNYEAGALNIQAAEQKLARDVKKTFYNLLLMEENIVLMERKIASAQRRYEQAKINYEFGLVDEYTMLSAQVGVENMKPGLEGLKMGYKSLMMNFKFLLGLDIGTDITLKGTIEPESITLDAKNLVNKYLTERLDIQGLVKQLEIVRNAKNATIAGMTPALTFMLSFDPAFMQDPFDEAWFKDITDNWSQQSGMFSVTVSVPLDQIIPYSQSRADIADSNDTIAQLRTSLLQAVKGAEMEIQTIVMNLQQTQKIFETLRLNVDLAQRAYVLAEEAYNAGGRALIDVEDAEDKLQEAEFEVLKEQYNYLSYLMDLEYALNTPVTKLRN